MPIDRTVVVKSPKYRATVKRDGTPVVATVDGDTVELSRPGARAILRVPIDEWMPFLLLIDETSAALTEKGHLEGATLDLPWEQPEADALVEAAPGGEDDEHSAIPIVEATAPGTPVPPRVTA